MYIRHQSILEPMNIILSIPMAARFLGVLVWVLIPPGLWMFVPCKCCVLSEVSATVRSLAQSSSTECGVSQSDRGTSITRRPRLTTAVEP